MLAKEGNVRFDRTPYEYGSAGRTFRLTDEWVWKILTSIGQERQLDVMEHFSAFMREPFFFIAATGLGKTVIVPLFLLFRNLHYPEFRPPSDASGRPMHSPRIWVVEPRVGIAQSLSKNMAVSWQRLAMQMDAGQEIPKKGIFGCKTRVDRVNVAAPVMFITTGIFGIYARKGMFQPGRDLVLIDEAHETIESDDCVELGISLCRMAGVKVNYMSATVDEADLATRLGVNVYRADQRRHAVWLHNARSPLEECIVEIVESALVRQDVKSKWFPKNGTPDAEAVIEAVTQSDRAKGLLIIVNSYAGRNSDARRIERLLRQAPFAERIEIRILSGATVRDPKAKQQYEDDLERWQRNKQRYVLIATSVVEMGITLPDLDFVVTTDSGFSAASFGSSVVTELGPLGVNSLIQRVGRVGRTRPGIAYITLDAGAAYSDLPDTQLNASGKLIPQPIKLPMRHGRLTQLAYHSLAMGWPEAEVYEHLRLLRLPSGIEDLPERRGRLRAERELLRGMGIAKGDGLTSDGEYCERWIGRADLAYACKAQGALTAKNAEWIGFWLIAAALHETTLDRIMEKDSNLSRLMQKSDEKHQSSLKRPASIELTFDGWELLVSRESEIATLYALGSHFVETFGWMTESTGRRDIVRSQTEFSRHCEKLGLIPHEVLGIFARLDEMFAIFHEANRHRPEYRSLFGSDRPIGPQAIPWGIDEEGATLIRDAVNRLPNRTFLTCHYEEDVVVWRTWQTARKTWGKPHHGPETYRTCVDPTPAQGRTSAKLVATSDRDGTYWRIVHLQHCLYHKPAFDAPPGHPEVEQE